MLNNIFSFLNERKIYYEANASIKKITSIKIGGTAELICYPNTKNDFLSIVIFAFEHDIPYKIIGRMTNILPCDSVCETLLISTSKLNKYSFNGKCVFCECGTLFSVMLKKLALDHIGGAEELISIPGSVGGMVYSNAGAYGKAIADFFKCATIYDVVQKTETTLYKNEMDFGYRSSALKSKDFILLNAEFEFIEKYSDKIFEDISYFKALRRNKQPIEYPSLGSIFKKNNGISAGELIDSCGLKGTRIGGAMISPKHAGFIVNYADATSEDVKKLIKLAEDEVYKKFGVKLEKEIEFLL